MISEATLKPFTDELIASRFNGPDMMAKGVYPEVWERDEENSREWVVDAAEELREFVGDCAEKGSRESESAELATSSGKSPEMDLVSPPPAGTHSSDVRAP